ncbi:MAG TPA: response regulator transcription factor [Acidimicrobiales bacterium]|jgi:two-component system response regulator RegX3
MARWLEAERDPRVVLVDGSRTLDDRFVAALAGEGFEVAVVPDGERGLSELRDGEPAVVLVNSDLPDMSGLAVLRRIRSSSHTPVIIVSDAGEETEAVLAFEMGAADYLHGLSRTREVAARIRAALARADTASTGRQIIERRGVLRSGPVAVDLGRREASIRGETVHLRPKEFDLLVVLVANAGYVVTTDRIFAEVWPKGTPRDSKSLHVHVRRLRAVVEEDPTHPRHIMTVQRTGVRFDP